MPTLLEKKWWPSVTLSPISVANSVITVSSVHGLHTKQIVDLVAIGQESQQFEIKRIISRTELQLGPIGKPLTSYSNPVAFNGGTLCASEQNRNAMDANAVIRAVYLEEPAVALRNVLVDQYGDYIDSVLDTHGIRRLAVDASFNIGSITVDVDSPNTLQIFNIPVALAGVEQVFTLPSNFKSFDVKVRDGEAVLNLAFNPAESGTNFKKVYRGTTWHSGEMDSPTNPPLSGPPLVLYYQVNKPNVIVEIVVWRRN